MEFSCTLAVAERPSLVFEGHCSFAAIFLQCVVFKLLSFIFIQLWGLKKAPWCSFSAVQISHLNNLLHFCASVLFCLIWGITFFCVEGKWSVHISRSLYAHKHTLLVKMAIMGLWRRSQGQMQISPHCSSGGGGGDTLLNSSHLSRVHNTHLRTWPFHYHQLSHSLMHLHPPLSPRDIHLTPIYSCYCQVLWVIFAEQTWIEIKWITAEWINECSDELNRVSRSGPDRDITHWNTQHQI